MFGLMGVARGAGQSGGAALSNTVDLFIITGQSNAVGIGVAAQSTPSDAGMYISGTTITPSPLTDPVGNANTGSSWPAFATEWAAQTGNRSAFVATASIGSALVTSGWWPSGTLRGAAVTACNNAITAINASTYDLGSVYFIWLQGETEAATINGTTITGATYEQALEDLAAYFKAQVPSSQPMRVILIAGPGSGSSTTKQAALHAGYQEIRAAQVRAIADSANLDLAYNGSFHFLGRGLLSDGTHYSQTGYDINGTLAARGITAGNTFVAGAPTVISTNNYPDTDYVFSSSRTVSHTTPAGTTCLIVGCPVTFTDSATPTSLSMTFNGVALRRAAFSEVTASGASVQSCIFYMDETIYGGTLAGVTANLVLTSSNNQRLLDICAINASGVAACDGEAGAFPTPSSTDTVSDTIATFTADTLVVSVATAAADAGAVLTATVSGFTEVLDHGLINAGLTRTAQGVVGYSIQTAKQAALAQSVTWSAATTHQSMVSASFRAKYVGE